MNMKNELSGIFYVQGNLIDEFFKIPEKVYKNDPVYVPEDRRELENKIFGKTNNWIYKPYIFMKKEGVARAVIIIPDDQQGWIGYFECLENHQNEGSQLLKFCVNRLVEKGIKKIYAPKADNVLVGLLVKRFDLPHMILSSHNPPYYQNIFKGIGFKKFNRLLSFYHNRKTIEKFKFKSNDEIRIRQFNPENIEGEAKIFNELNKQIFAGNNDYVPRTLHEEMQLLQSFRSIIDPEFILIAEYGMRPVGFIIALPDANQLKKGKEIDAVRIISIGIIPEMRRKHVGMSLAKTLIENVVKHEKYKYGEASFILNSNLPSKLLAMKFRAKPGREFELYYYPINL